LGGSGASEDATVEQEQTISSTTTEKPLEEIKEDAIEPATDSVEESGSADSKFDSSKWKPVEKENETVKIDNSQVNQVNDWLMRNSQIVSNRDSNPRLAQWGPSIMTKSKIRVL